MRFLSFVLGFAICAAAPAAAQTVIKLGAAQASIGSLPLVVAESRGFFAAEGVKIETFDFRGGAPAVQALASGSIAFCICAGDHAVRLLSRGLPAKIVAGLTERHGYALLALARSPLPNLAATKGKKLGITSPASLSDNSLRYALRQAGLNPDRDVTLATGGTGLPMKAALDTGAIDAGMFTTPDVQANMAEAGKYRIVHDFRTLDYTALDLIALESWLRANDRAARAFLRAVIRAQNLIASDPAALRAGLRQMFPNLAAPVVEALVKDVPVSLAKSGAVSERGYRTMIAMLGATEPELTRVPFADVVTRAYLPAN
jgi:NitT/TauT family transport system substrate-binding protein